jgi:hypothetical protein
MEKNRRIAVLKETLVEIYTSSCMEALKTQGIYVADGGKFYDKLFELIEESILFGDIR